MKFQIEFMTPLPNASNEASHLSLFYDTVFSKHNVGNEYVYFFVVGRFGTLNPLLSKPNTIHC